MVPEHLGGLPRGIGGDYHVLLHVYYLFANASLLASVFPPSRGAMGPLGLGPWLPWHPKGVVNPEVAAENRQPVVIPLVPKAHGPGEGNKRLPLYDFHRFFRLSWDNTREPTFHLYEVKVESRFSRNGPVNLGRRRVPSTETYATNLPTYYKITCTRLSVLSQESRKNRRKS